MPTLNREQLHTLRRCPVFSGMEEEELSSMLADFGCLQSHEKETLLPVSHLLGVLLSGRACIKKLAGDGHELIMDYMQPSRIFNMATIFLEGPELSRIYSVTDVTLLAFTKEEVARLIDGFSSFRQNYIKYLAGRLEFLNKKIENFCSYSSESRLLSYIEQNADGAGVLHIKNLKDLASVLNMGRASLYRALGALKEKGQIEAPDNKQIKLLFKGVL